MDILQAMILALVQGLTEFLPVSSSAHLILFPQWLGWRDQGLAFDVALHLGTLIAVIVCLRRDLAALAGGAMDALGVSGRRRRTPQSRMALAVVVATLPVVVVGWLAGDWVATVLRQPLVIAATTVVFGLLLWFAEYTGRRNRSLPGLGLGAALLIGCAQAVAVVPGVSRSGITMTAGLLLGLERVAAVRFSFVLSVPVILLAGCWQLWGLLQNPEAVQWPLLLAATALAALSAGCCIRWLLACIERLGFLPFVLYRLVLGGVLLFFYL